MAVCVVWHLRISSTTPLRKRGAISNIKPIPCRSLSYDRNFRPAASTSGPSLEFQTLRHTSGPFSLPLWPISPTSYVFWLRAFLRIFSYVSFSSRDTELFLLILPLPRLRINLRQCSRTRRSCSFPAWRSRKSNIES